MAEGRSNQGIAERLYITERAVEKHVTNIFLKLRAAGRRRRPPTGPGRAGLPAGLANPRRGYLLADLCARGFGFPYPKTPARRIPAVHPRGSTLDRSITHRNAAFRSPSRDDILKP